MRVSKRATLGYFLGSQFRSRLARTRPTRTARGYGVPASERVRGAAAGTKTKSPRLVLVARPAGFGRREPKAEPTRTPGGAR